MGKILYPVGTKVSMRKFYNDGIWGSALVPLKVVNYHKGEEMPYETQPVGNPDNKPVRRSVDELVSWKAMVKKYEKIYNAKTDELRHGPSRDETCKEDTRLTDKVCTQEYDEEIAYKEAYAAKERASAIEKYHIDLSKDTYGRNEVDLMMGNLLEHIDSVYRELASQIEHTQDVTDQNMREIANTFRIYNQRNQKLAKTLCHDDD